MNIKSIKNIAKNGLILILLAALISCVAKLKDGVPMVSNATYKPYNVNGERGYIVEFELSTNELIPTALVINRLKKTISSSDRNGLLYKVNVISETISIVNYPITGSDRDNGIFFKTETAKNFKKVNFVLK